MAINTNKKYTVKEARQSILNKWDWEDPSENVPIFLWGPIGIGKTQIVQTVVAERKLFELKKDLEKAEKDLEKVENCKNVKDITSDQADLLMKEKSVIEDRKSAIEDKINRLSAYDSPKQIADILEDHLLVLRLAERPIEQLQGIPAPDWENRQTVFLMPENAQRFAKDTWCVVFIDELDKADEAKMAAATHLIEAGHIGDFALPKDSMIIVAANRVKDSYISKPIVPELRNRAAHIEVYPDVDTWLEWAETEIPNKKTGDLEARITKTIRQFHIFCHKCNKPMLHVPDDSPEADMTYPFPTPRTWHMASNQEKKMERNGASKEAIIDEISQFVGEKAATEYRAYFTLYSKVDVEAILDGKQRIPTKGDKDRNSVISEQYIYAFAICDQLSVDLLKEKSHRIENLSRAIDDCMPDIRVIILKFIGSKKNKDICSLFYANPEGKKIISQFLERMKDII